MKKEYVTCHNRNFLRVEPPADIPGKLRYQYRILTSRKPEGFLEADFQINNGVVGLYYDISSMQNLKTWFSKRKVSALFLDKLVLALQTALWSAEQYLLDERNIILDPEFIFQDMETEKLLFFYSPYYAEKEPVCIEPLLTFLTEKLDNEELKAVESLYRIYSKWDDGKENFYASSIVNLWPQNPPVKAEEEELPEMPAAVGEDAPAYMGETTQTEERKLYGIGRSNRRVLPLDGLPVIIGRRKNVSDIVIEDATVGKMHVKISQEGDHIYMEDLNAPGGTYKNGLQLRPYEKVELLREDEIKIGRLEFTYR